MCIFSSPISDWVTNANTFFFCKKKKANKNACQQLIFWYEYQYEQLLLSPSPLLFLPKINGHFKKKF